MIRKAAVAGRFYPATPSKLQTALQGFVEPATARSHALGVIVPHAGYMYSGHVAGAVYAQIEIPARNFVLCPNHTGLGTPLSIMTAGAWETPLGQVQIDQELCEALIAADPYLQDDVEAHRFEHALEVQLPFLQRIAGPSMRFVPITIGTGNLRRLKELGDAIAQVVQNIAPGALIIASSDMNHYESDAITRVKDRKAIDQILAMNPEGLYEVVERERVTMCGYGAAIAMLTAAKQLGGSNARLVKYATSGDVSLDFDHVVGYAGIVVS
jgi:AmmeMemoRadiSam system protein B